MKKFFFSFASLLVVVVFASVSAGAADLDKVLSQMDAASAKFKNAQADFVWDNYTKVVDDHEQQSGTIYFDRSGSQTQMSAQVAKPDKKTVLYTGSKLYFYQPSIDQLSIFNASGGQYESFLTLGFGGSGKDLKTAWQIQDLGQETIDGVATEKLDLTSQQAKNGAKIDHITIWIDPTRAVSLKQIFYYLSGDTRTSTFTSIKYNAKSLPKGVFDVPKAKNTIQK